MSTLHKLIDAIDAHDPKLARAALIEIGSARLAGGADSSRRLTELVEAERSRRDRLNRKAAHLPIGRRRRAMAQIAEMDARIASSETILKDLADKMSAAALSLDAFSAREKGREETA